MKKWLFAGILLSVWSISCSREKKEPDLSGISLSLSIDRFEQSLFFLSPDSLPQELPGLEEQYGRFLDRFSYVINIGLPGDPEYPEYLRQFLSDPMIRELYQKVEESFPDLSALEDRLEKAFQYYLYYFPGKEIPEIYTYLSGFNHSLIIDKGMLGIGLDKYLGKETEYYAMLGIPNYMRSRMDAFMIPVDCMYQWALTEFPFNDSSNTVLSHMIYEGQLLYFTKKVMPDLPDSLIMGYSGDQITWVEENEKDMYTYLVEYRLLFDKTPLAINKLVGEGPFTQYFSEDSPGRAGAWLGWQMVRSYMKQHPETSLQELMLESNYQKLFSGSRYRPG